MNVPISAQQLAERFQQAFASGDAPAIAALYAEDTIYYDNSEVIRGREAVKEVNVGFFRAFPDGRLEFWNVMTCGETFVYEGTFRGTHTGPLAMPEGEIAPTGREIELRLAFFAKMNAEGLIQEDRTYYDSAQMMQQLGLG